MLHTLRFSVEAFFVCSFSFSDSYVFLLEGLCMAVYDLKRVTKAYVSGFYKYINFKKLNDASASGLYDLFSYSLKNIYGLPPSEKGYYIDMYGDSCIDYLKKLKGVPKRVDRLGSTERLSIVTMCQSYFVAVDYVHFNK